MCSSDLPVITAVLPRAIFPARVIPRRAELLGLLLQVRVACDHDARTVAVAFRVTVDARRETATDRLLVATSRRATAPAP